MSATKSTQRKKRISFAPGTAPPKEARIALSITNYETPISSTVTTYSIDVWQSGFQWVTKKRYKDFETLNKRLRLELSKYNYELPSLPQKRWFQAQRWFNRYDSEYVNDRRYALESYLRMLVRTPMLLERSSSLRNFLNITRLAADDFAMEAFQYQQLRGENTLVFEIQEPDHSENNIYHTEAEEDELEDEAEAVELERFSNVIINSNVDGTLDMRPSLVKKTLEELIGRKAEWLSSGEGDLQDEEDSDDDVEFRESEASGGSPVKARAKALSASECELQDAVSKLDRFPGDKSSEFAAATAGPQRNSADNPNPNPIPFPPVFHPSNAAVLPPSPSIQRLPVVPLSPSSAAVAAAGDFLLSTDGKIHSATRATVEAHPLA